MTFRANRVRAWFAAICGLFVLAMAVLLAWVFSGADKEPFTLARLIAGTIFVVINPMAWLGFWIFSVAVGIWRAKVEISDDGIELRAHQFRVWGLRRMKHARLKWNEITAVETFTTTNMMAPNGVQRDYVLHTTQGRFALPNILWPGAEEIATQVAARIEKSIGDVAQAETPAGQRRPIDRVGIAIMRGLGWTSLVLGILFTGLMMLAYAQKDSHIENIGPAIAVGSILIAIGASLRKFRLN